MNAAPLTSSIRYETLSSQAFVETDLPNCTAPVLGLEYLGMRLRSILATFLLLIPTGCGDTSRSLTSGAPSDVTEAYKSSKTQESTPDATVVSAFFQATAAKDWDRASELSKAVLIERPDDSEALFAVAEVAFHNGDASLAIELVKRACSIESYSDDQHIRQCVLAMLDQGLLYDAIEVLETVVTIRPDHHVFRRQLIDFYAMAERPEKASPHRRVLVQQRKFDLLLLMDQVAARPRELEEDTIEVLLKRNPADLRPLLAKAKRKYDQRRDAAATRMLSRIIEHNPTFAPAYALAIGTIARSGNLESVVTFAKQTPSDVNGYAMYWAALGDWAVNQSMFAHAARCYWQGTRRDANHTECWMKLKTSLQQISDGEDLTLSKMIPIVEKRATLLNSLDQKAREFSSAEVKSQKQALAIAQTLHRLGRDWECEAWAAIALTLSKDKVRSTAGFRNSVAASLRRKTPWQSTEGHPELELDLRDFPALDITRTVDQPSSLKSLTRANSSSGSAITKTGLKLNNEAHTRGLNFYGYTSKEIDQPGFMLHHTLGCGGGTLDYDLDGWSDVYFAAAGGTPKLTDSEGNSLFRNVGGTFTETTGPSGVDDRGFGQGIAIGDCNEDGFPDILVLNFGSNVLYVNQGDGTFSDQSSRWLGKQNGDSWSSSGAIADLNGDSLADIVALRYCTGDDLTTHKCFTKRINAAPSCSPMLFPAENDLFAVGRPEGGFESLDSDVALQPEIPGRGLGLVVGALDDIEGVDIFVTNDITNNHYWSKPQRADSDQILHELAMTRGLAGDALAAAQGSMGIAIGDFDQDGLFDLFVTNFADESNVLHRHRGDLFWVDDTNRFDLSSTSFRLVAFGTQMIDLDNDGQLEIVVSNGHVQILSPSGTRADYAQPFQVYKLNQQGKCQSIGSMMESEYIQSDHVGRALWTIDADRNGKPDVLVTHQTEPVALLINKSSDQHDWVEIQLVGTASSRDAIGAVVQLQYRDRTWKQPLVSGNGFQCSNERLLHFGLGDMPASDCVVTVTWPNGDVERFRLPDINRRWILIQRSANAFELN
ncbi:tetratricopeptide (TPR) repeat protein [Rhodopirellula rubra]|uniref:Tetratricopeptide (TPR) repeat protein n=1 Tax=Aporhodopirellula rubra TaxID=980271 RepID=A0A7W5E5C1_9BACT|nr:FG-GAP-like repeat-containing protein [Aporhodopirellula rubra]MBB3210496.1 tetratricopeptide (TPR) repeat protein [Aporhodopirellula rubra]